METKDSLKRAYDGQEWADQYEDIGVTAKVSPEGMIHLRIGHQGGLYKIGPAIRIRDALNEAIETLAKDLFHFEPVKDEDKEAFYEKTQGKLF